ncbi:hypothetical protein DTO271D3_910 [Paecilomyces variotii]|nr:hypothetical protein DTO032I3_8442 [Paecilomyces variotii]KAJ9277677.1 hypothetical protein DTO021D3_5511 [Paecilomyces variotii]KAJ9318780.1 hypothetical protein DTO271D3_910 [Paecilomyces variotii]KAJ9341937.1 hypothetical protein DTO027B6_5587 [Paecilomyces variotii]KAJ9389323.1 hypothetical protein DTO032I4_2348 [Paecilomyces variotii]
MVKDTIIPTTTELQKILISSSSTGPESLVSIHLDRDPFTTASYYGCSLAVLVQYKYSGPFRTIRILN